MAAKSLGKWRLIEIAQWDREFIDLVQPYARQHPVIPRPAESDSTSALPFAVSAEVLTQFNGNQHN